MGYYSAWGSALLVQIVMGNAKASNCGTSDKYSHPRFFVSLCQHTAFFFII